ncbi:hypothetical protein BS78_06G090000 [Paspalum vaginatum]|nr:hypothetical protein BS78_06G090000 [Paspalum vaginatum]
MLNHSHSRPDPRCSPLLLAHAHAAAEPTEPRGMDPPSSSGRGGPATPRRQLQGPRPPRLNVRTESHAIKKPSAAPPGQAGRRGDQQQLLLHTQQQAPARAPVIIYDASPKVIHAKPSEFMALVQRLTGPGAPGAAPPPPQPALDAQEEPHHMDLDADAGGDGDGALLLGQASASSFLPPELLLSPSAAMSPAARLATIERSVRPMPSDDYGYGAAGGDHLPPGAGDDDGTLAAALGPARHHPGILSPLPSALPPAAASGLFSPLPFDPACISWLNELSPILRAASAASPPAPAAGSRAPPPPPAYYSDPFVPSPRNSLLATPTVPSPATCADFFGSLPDL